MVPAAVIAVTRIPTATSTNATAAQACSWLAASPTPPNRRAVLRHRVCVRWWVGDGEDRVVEHFEKEGGGQASQGYLGVPQPLQACNSRICHALPFRTFRFSNEECGIFASRCYFLLFGRREWHISSSIE